jgi:DNA mismatch repair protein MutS
MFDNLTPMMKQYIDTKKKYPEGILLFRAGDFYEMFYDDAKIASKLLNITLTKRGKGETEAPLAGIPYHSIDPYIVKLVKLGKKVVICEQIEDPKKAKGLVKRAVTRIITPSTLFTDNYDNNYLCSISKLKESYGFSLIDITTNDFKVCIFFNLDDLLDRLSLIKPKELLLTKNILQNYDTIEKIKRNIPNTIINYTDNLDVDLSSERLKDHFNIKSLKIFDMDDNPEITVSAYNALEYIKKTQFSNVEYIKNIKEYKYKKYLKLDRKTLRNLELVTNLKDNSQQYSLFDLINNTKTAMGYRKLYFDLLHPLTDSKRLNSIYDVVEELISNVLLIEDLKQNLSYIGDLDKIISKIGFGNANPRDLISLKQSLEVLPTLKKVISETKSDLLKEIHGDFIDMSEIYLLLEKSIVNEPPFSVREGGFIKPNYSSELFNLINVHKSVNSWITEYEYKLKNETNLKSLKIKYNKIFGYYIEIPKSVSSQVPNYFERKQTLVNCERYTTKDLSEKESEIIHAREKRNELEYNLFLSVCNKIIKYQKEIKQNARNIGQIDVFLSHAITTTTNNYFRPEKDDQDILFFTNLRHPIIEKLITFIPNDVNLSFNNKTMIITGPNMAGKSSYMRSVALGVVLGCVGCFVPADSSKIGFVDGVFTRVGASDDILHGQSTFLVEMSEVSYILNHATKNSLVILDEVGRGTSTFDGISLAWSIIDYLNNYISSKTLVATHYHVLNKMQSIYKGVNNFHVTAKEEGNNLHFYHKLEKGGINKSYGIQVAKLAGINKEIIDKALIIQRDLENDSFLKNPTIVVKDEIIDTSKNKQNLDKPILYDKEQKKVSDY